MYLENARRILVIQATGSVERKLTCRLRNNRGQLNCQPGIDQGMLVFGVIKY